MLGAIVPRFFPTKKFGFATVLFVEIARGLDSAKVQISVERNAHQFDEFARKVVAQIQKEVNSNLPRKKIPKIIFELDRTNEIWQKIDKLENKN